MKYRRFGRTEIQMPVFSCGGMRYQKSWNDIPASDVPEANQANLEATIRRSLELGINHIETARDYGSSEMQLGWVLPKLPRDEMTVQTKVPPTADPKEFESTFEKSLSNLRLEHVDLLGIHGINNEELLHWTIREGGCMDVARRLQKEGRVRHIGFSTHAPDPLIRRAIETGAFDYVNLHWYYIFQDNWASIEAATRHDMGVFIISPNDKGGLLYRPSPTLVELCAPLSPMAFNDLFCLLRPEVHTLSIGASRPSDFDEHIKALQRLDGAAELIPVIEARLRAHAIGIVGQDWLDHYLDDVPRWSSVPGEINLRVILRLWTLLKCYDMVEFGKFRYNLLGNAEHWFPGQNLKGVDYASLESSIQNSRFAPVIIDRLKEAAARLGGQAKKRLSQSD